MNGSKKLLVDEDTLVQMVNYYVEREMPKLGVVVGAKSLLKSDGYSGFQLELAERQGNPTPPFLPGAPPVHEPDPPEIREPNVRVMRMEGVK